MHLALKISWSQMTFRINRNERWSIMFDSRQFVNGWALVWDGKYLGMCILFLCERMFEDETVVFPRLYSAYCVFFLGVFCHSLLKWHKRNPCEIAAVKPLLAAFQRTGQRAACRHESADRQNNLWSTLSLVRPGLMHNGKLLQAFDATTSL